MSNDGRKPDGVVPGLGRANGLIPASFRSLSRMVSYGSSTVASTVRSAVSGDSAIVERDSDASHYQVLWAGFDKLEWEGSTTQQVLLLGYRSGFQVWDVEEADNVRDLVSRHDGPVSFIQVLPKPITSKRSGDNLEPVVRCLQFVQMNPFLEMVMGTTQIAIIQYMVVLRQLLFGFIP